MERDRRHAQLDCIVADHRLAHCFYMAVIRIRGHKIGTGITRFYISFVRGTPLVLQILLMYSLLPSFINFALKSMGSSFNVFDNVNPFWYAVIVFSLNTIALLAEVFRSALMSINKGQLEAGVSVGLTEWQTYRHVIIPQAMVVALPAVCNITVNLIKGTSLAFLMTVKDVLAIGKSQPLMAIIILKLIWMYSLFISSFAL